MFTCTNILTIRDGIFIDMSYTSFNKHHLDRLPKSDTGFMEDKWEIQLIDVDGIKLVSILHKDWLPRHTCFALEDGLLLLGYNGNDKRPQAFFQTEDGRFEQRFSFSDPMHELLTLGITNYDREADLEPHYSDVWGPDSYTILVSDSHITRKILRSNITYSISKETDFVVFAEVYLGDDVDQDVHLITKEQLTPELIERLRMLLDKYHLRSFTELFELREAIERQAKDDQAKLAEVQEGE